jgi:hypothetical protein
MKLNCFLSILETLVSWIHHERVKVTVKRHQNDYFKSMYMYIFILYSQYCIYTILDFRYCNITILVFLVLYSVTILVLPVLQYSQYWYLKWGISPVLVRSIAWVQLLFFAISAACWPGPFKCKRSLILATKLRSEKDHPSIDLRHSNDLLLMEYIEGTENDVDIIIFQR